MNGCYKEPIRCTSQINFQFCRRELRENANLEPIRKEGVNEAKWALLDYGDLIINIFQPEIRKFYDLESFWSNGENLNFP